MHSAHLQAVLIAARKKKLSVGSLATLDLINNPSATRIGIVAEKLGISTSAATGLADRLHKLGYARRRHDDEDDRRQIYLEITPKGAAALKEILTPAEPALA